MRKSYVIGTLLLMSSLANAAEFNPQAELIGVMSTENFSEKRKLFELVRDADLGVEEFLLANDLPEKSSVSGTVLFPTQWILPKSLAPGQIVVNLSERRLFYLRVAADGKSTVTTFPVAVGKKSTKTPAGKYTVIEKIANPSWHVPQSIRKEDPSLPAVVPPGPKNPLGKFALRLTNSGLMLHGTTAPRSIGRAASHGCLRMYPEDIKELHRLVPRKTTVVIVDEPIKVGVADDKIYVEFHGGSTKTRYAQAVSLLTERDLIDRVDLERLRASSEHPSGIPENVSLLTVAVTAETTIKK